MSFVKMWNVSAQLTVAPNRSLKTENVFVHVRFLVLLVSFNDFARFEIQIAYIPRSPKQKIFEEKSNYSGDREKPLNGHKMFRDFVSAIFLSELRQLDFGIAHTHTHASPNDLTSPWIDSRMIAKNLLIIFKHCVSGVSYF